jgi:hypothetical protein
LGYKVAARAPKVAVHLLVSHRFLGLRVFSAPTSRSAKLLISFLIDEKVFKREISSFRNIKDNYPKFLLTLDYDNIIIDGIQKINIIDWLLK